MEVVADGLERQARGVELGSLLDVGVSELAAVRCSNDPGPREVFPHCGAMKVVGPGEVANTMTSVVVGQELGDLVLA